ncbi:uncharacterized protein LOC110022975 [Phalaenopsis equestris]|uniref:uncharacterized protein LOC110022975 n=1 Tax=Phalaenopsis equestris TaxID=78828 RepID=UPI0009E64312|nr:uncharacterized protein LOC110022975 [Phalaenopsis equestris]
MAQANSKITLKLLIDARSNKVLFGEAGKEFIDFLFSLLTLPLGSVIKLLSPPKMIGSIGKLYQSVENLSDTYLFANSDKSTLLQPKVSTFNVASPLLLGAEPVTEQKYYICTSCDDRITNKSNIMCPHCKRVMSDEIEFVAPYMNHSRSSGVNKGQIAKGFVKQVITYMITDDLEVTPISAISSVTLINRFSMNKDVQLEEKVVDIGMEEGLALLRASLDSPTVLTDVFCSSNKRAKASSSSAGKKIACKQR